MSWARFDDHFDDDEDLQRMSCEAIALHVCGTTWASRHLSDGHVPQHAVRHLKGATRKALDQLCDGGENAWWIRVSDGYQIRSYLKFNPSREQVLSGRRAATERKAKSRHESRRDTTGTNGVTKSVPRACARPDPEISKEILSGMVPFAKTLSETRTLKLDGDSVEVEERKRVLREQAELIRKEGEA